MALTPLTSANSFTSWDGTAYLLVGNTPIPLGKLDVARLDGTGTAFTNVIAFTASLAKPVKFLHIGDSHQEGGAGVHVIDDLHQASGLWGALDLSTEMYAVSGHTTQQMRDLQLPAAKTWIAANEGDYSLIIPIIGGGINDGSAATDETALTNQVIANRRYICQQLALASPKVRPLLLGTPPTINYRDTDLARFTLVDNARKAWDLDAVNNYHLYLAAAATPSFLLDPIYTADYHLAHPGLYQDGTHYGGVLSTAWCTRHWLRPIMEIIAAPASVYAAVASITVDPITKTLTFPLQTNTLEIVYQYTLNAGAAWAWVTSRPVTLPNGSYAGGGIGVRRGPLLGGVAGPAVYTTDPYTISAVALPPYTNGTFVPFLWMHGANIRNAAIDGSNNVIGGTLPQYAAAGDSRQFTGNGAVRATLVDAQRNYEFGLFQVSYGLPANMNGSLLSAHLLNDNIAFNIQSGATYVAGAPLTVPFASGDYVDVVRYGSNSQHGKIVKNGSTLICDLPDFFAGVTDALYGGWASDIPNTVGTNLQVMSETGFTTNAMI